VLGAPELDIGLLGVSPEQSRGAEPPPSPCAHAAGDAAQGTLMGHVELLVSQHPQVLLLRAALDPLSAQPVVVLGIAPTRVQDLALGLVELHEQCREQFCNQVEISVTN